MKFLFFPGFFMLSISGLAQNIQFHYDFRHSLDPNMNSKNFPTFNFEYFKEIDTGRTGSFLFKIQADLNGTTNNVGQVYTQISQSLKFWKPKIYLSFNYSGGLGMVNDSTGFFIPNSFSAGLSYPFQWKGAWFAVNVLFRYNSFDKPSYDPQVIIYFGRGFLNYRVFTAGSFVIWTENRNQGNDYTKNLRGKKLAFFGDPQVWIRIKKGFSAGSRINLYYHILSDDKHIQYYPTLGIKFEF